MTRHGRPGRLVGLDPIIDGRARILVLGSFPSAASIAAACYYAHPRNHFWPIVSLANGEPFPEALSERSVWALGHGIAIWDSLGSCVRPGSLDGDISQAVPNDILGLLMSWPSIERVLLNGSTAVRYLRVSLRGRGEFVFRDGPEDRKGSLDLAGRRIRIFSLPSTSPVPSREFRRMEDKLPLWLAALGRDLAIPPPTCPPAS